MPRFAALILAAGYSSRMGDFKPLLPLGGKRAIEWAVEAFRLAGIADIGVVTGHRAPELEPELRRLKVATLRNPAYDTGMYSSIRAGIGSLAPEVDGCFVLPVDIPLVRPATVAAIAARYDGSAPVFYPTFRGQRGHPPLIGAELFAEIAAGDGTGGLRAILQQHAATAVAVADQAILFDMDTPEDYRRLDGLAQRRDVPSVAECEAIMELHGVAEPVRRHGRAVAAVAAALAGHLDGIDAQLVVAAGLLHDVAKGQPAHAEAGAALIDRLGYPALAAIIGQHMDLDLAGERPDAAAVVFIADKLVREDRRIPLEARFQPAFERFAGQPDALAGAQHRYQSALRVLQAIEARAGTSCDRLLAACGVPS
jgi:CTP:molybdopterin cytidylyltransferase MocA